MKNYKMQNDSFNSSPFISWALKPSNLAISYSLQHNNELQFWQQLLT